MVPKGGVGGGGMARATGLRDKRTGKGRVQRSREQLSIKDGNVSATALCSRPWELLALHCIRMPFSLSSARCSAVNSLRANHLLPRLMRHLFRDDLLQINFLN